MKRLVIGDIHGCYEELLALLEAAGISDEDEVISVGDMVDSGPCPADVLGFFRSRPRARAILGNHERKHILWRRGLSEPKPSQRRCRRQLGEEVWNEAVDWFDTLPLWLDLDEATLVHAYVEPGVALEDQRPDVLVGHSAGRAHLDARVNGTPWYETYDGSKPLIVGHKRYGDGAGGPVDASGRLIALDTDCCRGGRLTGVLLPSFELVSVPGRPVLPRPW